jgi:hypothetical protein
LKGFFWPRKGYDSDAHLQATAAKIRSRATEIFSRSKHGT